MKPTMKTNMADTGHRNNRNHRNHHRNHHGNHQNHHQVVGWSDVGCGGVGMCVEVKLWWDLVT